MEKIILAGGCFWCTETIFKSLKGVESAIPGYSGGDVENPTYWQVSSGKSGHAESVEVAFDPKEISLEKILYVFFKLHDPTELNRQGADVGTQYRSAIFYFDDNQKKIIDKVLTDSQKNFEDPIVTEIAKFTSFYPAEPEHRDYYFRNKGNIYCTLVIDPKIQMLRREFSDIIK